MVAISGRQRCRQEGRSRPSLPALPPASSFAPRHLAWRRRKWEQRNEPVVVEFEDTGDGVVIDVLKGAGVVTAEQRHRRRRRHRRHRRRRPSVHVGRRRCSRHGRHRLQHVRTEAVHQRRPTCRHHNVNVSITNSKWLETGVSRVSQPGIVTA